MARGASGGCANWHRRRRGGPRAPRALGRRGDLLAARGQVSRALGYADKALRLDDRRVAAHVARGHLCLRLRRPDDAVGSFRRAVALCASARGAPGAANTGEGGRLSSFLPSGAALASRAGLVAGYLLQRRRKEALAAAKEALALAPGSALARALVGDAYLARGTQNAPSGGASASADFKARAEKAKKHFESALALRPFDSRLALALSEAQRVCGEPAARPDAARAPARARGGGRRRWAATARWAVLASLRMRRMPRASTSARVAWTLRASPRSGVWRASSV